MVDGGNVSTAAWCEPTITNCTATQIRSQFLHARWYVQNVVATGNTLDLQLLESTEGGVIYLANTQNGTGDRNLVDSNTISRTAYGRFWPSDGIPVYAETDTSNTTWSRNRIDQCKVAYNNNDGDGNKFIYNYVTNADILAQIHDIGDATIVGCDIQNNTMICGAHQSFGAIPFGNESLIRLRNIDMAQSGTVDVRNNIFVGTGHADQYGLHLDANFLPTIVETNNCFYNVTTPVADKSEVSQATGTGTITTDPGLVTSDYQLSSSSSNAANAGTAIAGVTDDRDFHGNYPVDDAGAEDMGCAHQIDNGPPTEYT